MKQFKNDIEKFDIYWDSPYYSIHADTRIPSNNSYAVLRHSYQILDGQIVRQLMPDYFTK